MQNDLTEGSIFRAMLRFSIPYLISCFLQTFYGMADLFITGQFNGADAITAVAVGSQVMHMLTVVLVGLAMGGLVTIGRNVGAKKDREVAASIGNTVTVFAILALVLTAGLLIAVDRIIAILATPPESASFARDYLVICFAGVPFVIAYNVISSIFRGLGDTKRPMYFVAFAGVINIVLDYLLIGHFRMSAAGAAAATVVSQALSVAAALISLRGMKGGIALRAEDFRPRRNILRSILGIGIPVAFQEGLIQVSFLAITAIANSRGVDMAAAVGIVEKIISFLFLVPSAMLSTVSALSAQNAGAGRHDRSMEILRCGIRICAGYGLLIFLVCQFCAPGITGLFVKGNETVARLGGQYLRSYSIDCIFAGIHFCCSGFFSAYGKSGYSFLHNILSIITFRIPGAYLASVHFPDTLYPMGLAAPMGSLLSCVICFVLYLKLRRTLQKDG